MPNSKLIDNTMVHMLIEDMYEAMDYLDRHLDTISFVDMHEMIAMIEGIALQIQKFATEETKVSAYSALVNWSQLKIKTQRALMNSRIVLC